MARIREFVEKQKQKTRLEVIKSWFSSFAVTAVAVVAVVVLVPKSPMASFERIETFANEIIYQLQVTDEDSAIIEGTLKLVVENQMEYYETSLALGQNSGIVTSLRANTSYQVSVMADKGFGSENLDSLTIKTLSRVGGAIVTEMLVSDPAEWLLDYEVSLFFNDPETEFKEVRLNYGYMYPGGDELYDLDTIVLVPGQTSAILNEIPNYNVTVVLTLEGTRQNDEIETLDVYNFQTPLNVSFSFSLSQVTTNSVMVFLYPDSSVVSDVSFKVILSTASRKVQEQDIDPAANASDHHHYGIEVEFTGLRPSTIYFIELEATYTNPYTRESITEIVGSMEFSTLGAFDYILDIAETDTHFVVTITLTDPDHNFQNGYYYVFMVEPGEEINYGGSQSGFTPDGDQKHTTIEILKPSFANYRIEIGVRNSADFYKYVVLDNIRP